MKMKSVYMFPGQGSQFVGMGKDLYEESQDARDLFDIADEVMGFSISNTMISGTKEDLKRTDVTQPAVYLYSVINFMINEEVDPQAVAGHSLGEISALVAANVLTFRQGLELVKLRSTAMQQACLERPGAMSAILGMGNEDIERITGEVDGIVVPANYNCPGQLVISGEIEAVEKANELLTKAGARRALLLPVGGAFHSPLMEGARAELAEYINSVKFKAPRIPIYQNVVAKGVLDSEQLKENLIIQLTNPVRWTQTIEQLIKDGFKNYVEVGAKVLSGFVKKVDKNMSVEII